MVGISLKELKKNRLTPAEKWVLGAIEGVKPIKLPSGNVLWLKDGRFLFKKDFQNGYLNISNPDIWSVLEDKFGLNNNEIQELINNVIYDYTDNGKLKLMIW